MTFRALNIFSKRLKNLNKNSIKVLKEEAGKGAKPFNDFLIKWLKNREYPLRGGASGTFRDDDTERLNPGKHLWEAQRVSVRKAPLKNSVVVSYINDATHAKYFFPEIKPHDIPGNDLLKFWWGSPLPWDPLDGKPSGTRVKAFVNHPGHISYRDEAVKSFDKYEKYLEEARDRSAGRLFE